MFQWLGSYAAEFTRVAGELGFDAALTGASGGQYEYSDGLNFGGTSRSRSNLILERICKKHLSQCSKVAYVEWHTGFGAFGDPFFVCLHPEGSASLAQARLWFSDYKIGDNAAAFGGNGVPDWRGTTWDGVTQQFLPNTRVVGAIVEYGTYSNAEVAEALMMDRWLKFGKGPDDDELRHEFRQTVAERFNPDSIYWRSRVIRHGLNIHKSVLRGMQL